MVKRTGRAIVSRANTNHLRNIRARRISNVRVQFFPKAEMIVIKRGSYEFRSSGGRVGLLTAGTSDIPIAEEARIIADEMGCETRGFYDVGVAGLHRLFKPLTKLLDWNAMSFSASLAKKEPFPTAVQGRVTWQVI